MKNLSVAAAAGGSGDRTDVAAPLVATLIRRGGPSVLIFENLAERTLAFAHLARRANPDAGYDPYLDMEVRPVLADCLKHGIPIVSNFGAANPRGAAKHLLRMAAELNLPPPRIAIVEGDDLSSIEGRALIQKFQETDNELEQFISANVYLGAMAIADALKKGAQIVVTGRVADPALVLGPALAHFGWATDDWDRLAGATMAGHLLECGAQVTGGYFADPGRKDVPDLDQVGYPIAEIAEDGSCIITKTDNSGGVVNVQTVKEQLLYELHDPAAYLTPDVIADVTQAQITQIGPNSVRLSGVRGHKRPPTLKALVYFEGGWLGEGEISYAGPNAEARARLSMQIMKKRMGSNVELRFDLIGSVSIFGDDAGNMIGASTPGQATDVRLRVAMRHLDIEEIERLHREITAIWIAGPAGGGGVRVAKRQRLSNVSCYIPREHICESFYFMDQV